MFSKCQCGKYHCPSCQSPMDEDFLCPRCNRQWTGKEKFNPLNSREMFDLYE